MVPRSGFEPETCPLGGGCAIQLCHRGEIAGTRILKEYGEGCKADFNCSGKDPVFCGLVQSIGSEEVSQLPYRNHFLIKF